MGEHDDEELQRAVLMSLQPAPDAKRSKPRDNVSLPSSSPRESPSSTPIETPEARQRRLQREVLAAAAEQRWTNTGARDSVTVEVDRTVSSSPSLLGFEETSTPSKIVGDIALERKAGSSLARSNVRDAEGKRRIDGERQLLSLRAAERLYSMVFGTDFSKELLAQWCNQGFRFSQDLETSVGLVQQEGGPCGVLAPIQALVLKYLLFVPEDDADAQLYSKRDLHMKSTLGKSANISVGTDVDSKLIFTDVQRTRALVRAMGETLWRAGARSRAFLVVLDVDGLGENDSQMKSEQDEALADVLDGISLDSVTEFHRLVRVYAIQSLSALHLRILSLLPAFRSRFGALLMLFSALLSRGLDAVQSDRDDPDQPLVTPPFGHASQEIVNLLLCGQAVPNVFDGSMDLGGGMCLKGIPTNVEVGFLSLLESLNLCKVGQRLKRPVWPVWVIGSESHYTVLFASSTTVQDESDIEDREARIRQAFDSHDQSGGGGFISLEALQQVIRDFSIEMPPDMSNNLCSSDIVVWNEFWRCLCELDVRKGGLKDTAAQLGKRHFELLHFNGIAKAVITGNGVLQRPRLIKMRVTVPPKWTPENAAQESSAVTSKDEAPQHAPLVDCIRTRWQRATCNWSSDAPSIV